MSAATAEQRVPLEAYAAQGELWGALLDVRTTLDRAVRVHGDPRRVNTVLHHPIYKSLIASLAGMQELMAIERLDQAIADGSETIVIDTAPSRHALEFLDKPEYFTQLVSSPVVRLVGRAYRLWESSPLGLLSRKSLELYTQVEALLGTTLVKQILDFYSVFYGVAEGYAERAKRTAGLLRNARTTGFFVVTTPFKAARDTAFFRRELEARRFPLRSITVNRAWPRVDVELPPDASAQTRDTLRWYQDVSEAHRTAWEKLRAEYPDRTLNLVPELPRDVDGLPALAQIAEHL
jgi:anion-transporting  ArsA/GET3 family ATPase